MRRALANHKPPPSMTDVVRLVHELQSSVSSSACSPPTPSGFSPSPPPPKAAKTPPPPAASPAGRSKRISANQSDQQQLHCHAPDSLAQVLLLQRKNNVQSLDKRLRCRCKWKRMSLHLDLNSPNQRGCGDVQVRLDDFDNNKL